MTAQVGFPLQTVYEIVDITQDKPATVTLAEVSRQYALSVAEGQTVTIHNVNGMFQINYQRFIVTNFDAGSKTFQLYEINGARSDTRSYNAYDSGGQIDIISFPGTPPGLMFNND